MSSEHAHRPPWPALLAPPVAWFTALTAAYFMVAWACRSGVARALLHGVLLACLAPAAAGGRVALRSWRRSGGEWPGEGPDPRARARFLAVLGLFGGILFSVTILWFWLATLVLSPCEPSPRLPFAPSAGVEAAARLAS